MRINTNIMGMFAYRNYNNAVQRMAKSMQRLSSGYRINSAADDPAGLAISEKMRAQIRGLNMASRNCQDAISLIQTAEGSMDTAHQIAQRMREIAVQSASDTNESMDRKALNAEYQELMKELNDISKECKFNGISLLDGSRGDGNPLIIQSGPNQGDTMDIALPTMNATALGLTGTGVGTREDASSALEKLDEAIKGISLDRAVLGAKHNRLEHKISNLDTMSENLSAAESRIRDVDIAKEMMEYTKQNILMQISMSMIAQANSQQQMVLQLLKF